MKPIEVLLLVLVLGNAVLSVTTLAMLRVESVERRKVEWLERHDYRKIRTLEDNLNLLARSVGKTLPKTPKEQVFTQEDALRWEASEHYAVQ